MESTPNPTSPLDTTAASCPRREEPAMQLRLFDPDGGVCSRLRLALWGWRLLVTGDRLLAGWEPLVLVELRRRFGGNEATAQKVVAEAARLFRYWAISGASKWADLDAAITVEWYWRPRTHRGGFGRGEPVHGAEPAVGGAGAVQSRF